MHIRPATEADIQPICDLVNHFADQNLMLRRTPEQVRLALGNFLVVVDQGQVVDQYQVGDQNQKVENQNQVVADQNQVVGCGYIAYLSPTLAEIRSLAIHPDQHGKGLGGLLVDHLAKIARAGAVRQICALTLAPDFFYRQGFHRVDRWSISPKIWGECVYCPKFHACDEIAVMKVLDISD